MNTIIYVKKLSESSGVSLHLSRPTKFTIIYSPEAIKQMERAKKLAKPQLGRVFRAIKSPRI